MDKRYYSFDHRFVHALLLLAIVISSFILWSIPQQVIAEINNSARVEKIPISNSSSQLERKTTGNEKSSDLNQTYLPVITAVVTAASAAAALATRHYAKKHSILMH